MDLADEGPSRDELIHRNHPAEGADGVERGGRKNWNRFARLLQGVVHSYQSNQREEEDLNSQADVRDPARFGFTGFRSFRLYLALFRHEGAP